LTAALLAGIALRAQQASCNAKPLEIYDLRSETTA
jgi:hypothetical protein